MNAVNKTAGWWPVVIMTWVAAGCTTSFTPPADPASPVVVYMLDHGRHPTLVLPREDGTLVRYGYGEWNWYAMERTGLLQGMAALFWPTRGALGRRELESFSDLEQLHQRDPVEHVYIFYAEGSEVARLRKRLDDAFDANRGTAHYNRNYDLHFVHHPAKYSALRNSNHLMGQWLADLGCRVRGPSCVSQWQMVGGAEATGWRP